MGWNFFLDSSVIYASADRDNLEMPKIKSFLHEKNPSLVTTNLVFAESISLLTKRLGKKVAEQTGDFLQQSQFTSLVYLDEEIQKEAWQLYKKYKDKDFDFIDATSFVFCQRHKIKEVLTLDAHFAQMGFKICP